MSIHIPTLTFFNNKGGVGKTTLVYHLSWMLALLGVKVLVVDCDPQANLTGAFIDETSLLELWEGRSNSEVNSVYESVKPLTRIGDFTPPQLYSVHDNLKLIAGDLSLSSFEDQLSEQWGKALTEDSSERAMLVLSAFWRMAQTSAASIQANIIIFDVGPNLGAINRSILIGTDHVVVPLAADMFSLQGLRNLGPALRKWREEWKKRLDIVKDAVGALPSGIAEPLGYIALQHQERLKRPVQAYVSWLERIPAEYRKSLGMNDQSGVSANIDEDPNCLARLRHYKSLIPLAQEARKPVFLLKSADGAIGSHSGAVNQAYEDFEMLAKKILTKIGVAIPVRS
ncbi:MAG: ParA family protein [Cytophagales bacterium]|nr:ParA family protein [Cytophagales bacterium]